MLIQVRTDRADREGHLMDIDPETGEVIETSMESPEKRPQSPESALEWVELIDEDDLPF